MKEIAIEEVMGLVEKAIEEAVDVVNHELESAVSDLHEIVELGNKLRDDLLRLDTNHPNHGINYSAFSSKLYDIQYFWDEKRRKGEPVMKTEQETKTTQNEDEVTDWQVIQAMLRYGGGFISSLSHLYQVADSDNKKRIRDAWPEYWEEFTDMARHLNQQNKGVKWWDNWHQVDELVD